MSGADARLCAYIGLVVLELQLTNELKIGDVEKPVGKEDHHKQGGQPD